LPSSAAAFRRRREQGSETPSMPPAVAGPARHKPERVAWSWRLAAKVIGDAAGFVVLFGCCWLFVRVLAFALA
jgi:hypothetical protein